MMELISREKIKKRTQELGNEIAGTFGPGQEVVVIALLDGSFMFLADLIRVLHNHTIKLQVDFIGVSSYGKGTRSSGRLRWRRRLARPVRGQRILLVDDILDTGLTLAKVQKYLLKKRPALLKTCVLLNKDKNRIPDIKADFSGFTIPDVFVAGYGMDKGGRYRELPSIVAFHTGHL